MESPNLRGNIRKNFQDRRAIIIGYDKFGGKSIGYDNSGFGVQGAGYRVLSKEIIGSYVRRFCVVIWIFVSLVGEDSYFVWLKDCNTFVRNETYSRQRRVLLDGRYLYLRERYK